jgi:hypothetical protein
MPDVVDINWEADEFSKAKEMINFGISLSKAREHTLQQFEKNYNAYHGEYTTEELKKITDVYGEASATEFVGKKLGKVKLDRLIGEAIELNFQAEVTTVNREAVIKKAQEIATAKGRSLMKPFIEQVQQQGHDIYSGVKIPDYGDPNAWDPKKFRTNNERIMQILLERKLQDPEADYIYPMLFISCLFTSEIHSLVVDRGAKNYFIQPIPSEQMIFMDSGLDNQIGKSPIVGHKEKMTFGDVVKRFDLIPHNADYNKVKLAFQGGNTGSAGTRSTDMNSGAFNWVYFFQWRIYKTKWFKIEEPDDIDVPPTYTDVSKEYNSDSEYRKSTDQEVTDQKYKLQRVVIESLYQGASVGGDVFVGIKECSDIIKTRDYKNRFNVVYDYTITLVKTIGNKRTAYANVMLELNKEYDYVQWLIKKNIKKLKVAPIYVDKAALGKTTLNKFLHDAEENDVIIVDSSSEELNYEMDDVRKVMGTLNAQSNASNIIQSFLMIASNIERGMDLLTGINDARQGIEKATTTATTNQSNLRASRSVTYDLFYFTQKHEEIAITKVLQKEKLAIALNPEEYQFMDEFDSSFLKATVDIALDDYSARVTDGKKEHDLKADIDMYLPQEVNSGKISTADVIDFKIASSFAEAVDILHSAVARTEEIQSKNQQSQQQSQQQISQQQIQAATADREDKQSHEKELVDIVEENKIRLKEMDVQAKAVSDTNKNITSIYQSAQKLSEAKKNKPK